MTSVSGRTLAAARQRRQATRRPTRCRSAARERHQRSGPGRPPAGRHPCRPGRRARPGCAARRRSAPSSAAARSSSSGRTTSPSAQAPVRVATNGMRRRRQIDAGHQRLELVEDRAPSSTSGRRATCAAGAPRWTRWPSAASHPLDGRRRARQHGEARRVHRGERDLVVDEVAPAPRPAPSPPASSRVGSAGRSAGRGGRSAVSASSSLITPAMRRGHVLADAVADHGRRLTPHERHSSASAYSTVNSAGWAQRGVLQRVGRRRPAPRRRGTAAAAGRCRARA